MSARKRTAFTLTEMLVVISIIGVLVSMLLPAVQQAREGARRAVCASNIAQCAKAVIAYDAAKGFLPPARAAYTVSGSTVIHNWVVPVLPQLERQDLRDTIRGASEAVTAVAGVTIPVLQCPSDPYIKANGSLSYKVNGGRQNRASDNFDYLANGLFVDRAVLPHVGEDKARLDGLRDGVSTTILMAENLVLMTQQGAVGNEHIWATAGTEKEAEILWWPDCPGTTGGPGSDYVALNQDWTTAGSAPSDPTRYARPASYHPGGFQVAFCDGSVRFMSESVLYKIYAVLMTSYGANAANPANNPPSPALPPAQPAWQSPSDSGYPGTKF